MADRILARVQEVSIAGEEAIRCTVSIGIAHFQQADTMFNDIVRRADACLYEAKRQGKNRYNLS